MFVGKIIWAIMEEEEFGVSSVMRWGIMLVSILGTCWENNLYKDLVHLEMVELVSLLT